VISVAWILISYSPNKPVLPKVLQTPEKINKASRFNPSKEKDMEKKNYDCNN